MDRNRNLRDSAFLSGESGLRLHLSSRKGRWGAGGRCLGPLVARSADCSVRSDAVRSKARSPVRSVKAQVNKEADKTRSMKWPSSSMSVC